MLIKKYVLIILIILCSESYAADLYKIVDTNGHVTYTNKPEKNAVPIEIQEKHQEKQLSDANKKLQHAIAQDPNLETQWQTSQKLHRILQQKVLDAFTAHSAVEKIYQQVLQQNQQLSIQLSNKSMNTSQKIAIEKQFATNQQSLVSLQQKLEESKNALATVQQQLNDFKAVLIKFKQ